MKSKFLLYSVSCLLSSILTAQWLDTIIPVGASPIALCFNPQDNRVYCACFDDSSVASIDGATNTVLAMIRVDAQPRALCYNPTNNKVFCANENGRSVSIIDGAANTVVATTALPCFPWDCCYNPTTDKVYVVDAFSSVCVLDGSTFALDTVINPGNGPYGLCCNPVANRIYTANRTDNSVTVIDGASNTVMATIPVGPIPNRIVWNSR